MDLRDLLKGLAKVKLNIFLNNPTSIVEFPIFDLPKISIILVLYNKAELTYQCLETIKAHADVPYEIIIVDNNSSDATSELLGKIKNTIIIKNRENIGFLKGSNQGAKLARGEWLLFLNNDTQITPSLLSILIQTAEKTEHCGAVGGKLIFPDGKLQEAGSIIWNDGSCSGYGRGDDPFKPEYSYVKEVDFCSAACLLIKNAIFKEAGMFDEIYHPGYYEETDLCMKIRELGYKVIYQPSAVVIHYEFGSSSLSEAMKQQSKNKEIFAKKWQHHLNELFPPLPANILYAREFRRVEKYNLLVIDDRIPIPELGRGYPRSLRLLKGLAEANYRVALFPLQFPEKVEPYAHDLQQIGVEVIFNSGNEKLNFSKFIKERYHYYDLILISRPHNMREVIDVIKKLDQNQKIIYDAEALFSARDILKLELKGHNLSEQMKNLMIRDEINLMKNADLTITVSEREKQIIESFDVKKVKVVSHQVDIHATPKSFDQRKDILFVGGFTPESPNEDAMLYFVNQVYSQVYKELGAKLWIVGSNFSEPIKNLDSPNIIVTGTVHNLWDYYNNCRVFVVPTRYAAGISLKLLECLSHGLPAVVTPLIAQQLGINKDIVLLGNGPLDFANKIVKCYTKKRTWNRLRKNSLKYIANEYNSEVFKQQILGLEEIT
ncbi:glycosyltransferase [Effusibacillus consociatus]|uniref:Glycosyltransferase n=1 Tax=Effusibacillus consociatus TaxID=1117041 RepID=A0ABV9Q1H1_9BACL